MTVGPAKRNPTSRWTIGIGWALLAIATLNALLFTIKAAIPVVISDGWYFIGTFVAKFDQGTLTLGDFFVKRSAIDHSVPLHKLLLLANVWLLDLDPTLDAYVGLGFALAMLIALWRILRQSAGDRFASVPVQLAFGAICAIALSLNASVIFSWPLLTMAFCSQFFCFLVFVLAWRTVAGDGRYGVLAFAATACLIVADGSGVIALMAASLAIGWLAAKSAGASRARAWKAMGVMVACAIVYKVGYAVLAPPYTDSPLPSGIAPLLAIPDLLPHMLQWVQSALAGSIIHPSQAHRLFGGATGAVNPTIAVVVAMAHGWFWWHALRREPTVINHLGVCCMLFFYGLFLGVLVARVPAYGGAAFSFNQARYVVFYQLNIVALLLMAIDAARRDQRALTKAGVVMAALAIILVQLPLARASWTEEASRDRYNEHLAEQIQQLAIDPSIVPPCSRRLTVCQMSASDRKNIMELMVRRRLNVFSDTFRQRHGLPPLSAVMPSPPTPAVAPR